MGSHAWRQACLVSTTDTPVITGVGQTPYLRLGKGFRPTEELLADAAWQALHEADVARDGIDGLAVASFTLAPDRAIDLAVKLGLTPTWIMDSGLGGASGIDMLQHAAAALAHGDATRILVVAGDGFTLDTFAQLVQHYNQSMIEDYAGITGFGPNAMFALVTQMQMDRLGLVREDYGRLICRQREFASRNPNAAFRSALSMDDYLAAPMIADPLTRLDCVPVVSGANAIVLELTSGKGNAPAVAVRAITANHNYDLHEGDGQVTGIASCAPRLWASTGWSPEDAHVLAIYDDYPAMIIAQLIDAGIISARHARKDLLSLLDTRILNGSGGQLSAGQCGAGAGLHGIVDAVEQLRLLNAGMKGLVTGYGMVVNRYGACANVAALERLP